VKKCVAIERKNCEKESVASKRRCCLLGEIRELLESCMRKKKACLEEQCSECV
jgi:hypothetical protein